jgi:hypothetical protein
MAMVQSELILGLLTVQPEGIVSMLRVQSKQFWRSQWQTSALLRHLRYYTVGRPVLYACHSELCLK